MLRTRLEREEELQALNELARQIPLENEEGEDNDGAIHAQINVIELVLTSEQVNELYDDGDDFVLHAAVGALRWLRDDDEAPSEAWQEEFSTTAN